MPHAVPALPHAAQSCVFGWMHTLLTQQPDGQLAGEHWPVSTTQWPTAHAKPESHAVHASPLLPHAAVDSAFNGMHCVPLQQPSHTPHPFTPPLPPAPPAAPLPPVPVPADPPEAPDPPVPDVPVCPELLPQSALASTSSASATALAAAIPLFMFPLLAALRARSTGP